MNNNDIRQLCLDLIRADYEDEVVGLLSDRNLWDNPACWRFLGDNENNFSVIGNQQADPIAALAEKVVNSIDARLLNAGRMAGIDPEGDEAPKSIRQAVATLFEKNRTYDPDRHGQILNWTTAERGEQADLITVAATGATPRNTSGRWPSLTISDLGEGQAPSNFPETFLSLQKSNKLRIPFVQGKFNMGGTGALQFCSPSHNLQLIVSKRNPSIATAKSTASGLAQRWGYTIVRRKDPAEGRRSSHYEYLAPVVGSDQADGQQVLSFTAVSMPLFPNAQGDPYARKAEYGSLVKLFEYEWLGDRSDITRGRTGLLRRLEAKIVDPALPFRVYECRGYRKQAPYHNGVGLVNFVGQNEHDLDEMGGASLSVTGKSLKAKWFLFAQNEGRDLRMADDGVLLTVNGQTHASFHTRFFNRKNVNKAYIGQDLLVVVDCSEIDGRQREDLFMNSRDRLREGDVARQLEREW